MKSMAVLACIACLVAVGQTEAPTHSAAPHRKVLAPTTTNNLTIYPIVASTVFDTSWLLTLDEGIQSGEVVITENNVKTGGIRRPWPSIDSGIWSERPRQSPSEERGPSVNELSLINKSGKPLLLLAGEIVTGGKQDRVVSQDRIIPAHSLPVALGVFCVEPHRWTETSSAFGVLGSALAQPSVRSKAMAAQNQQAVWNEVAKSRASFVAMLPAPQAKEFQSTSSYAAAMQNKGVKQRVDSMVLPLDKLGQQLSANSAVGVVVAVNGELIWADVFASPDLLNRYWPKLVRSYAAEALSPRVEVSPAIFKFLPHPEEAQAFLDYLSAGQENVSTEPGLYRSTELTGDDFQAFILTALLPKTGFDVHLAKIKGKQDRRR